MMFDEWYEWIYAAENFDPPHFLYDFNEFILVKIP